MTAASFFELVTMGSFVLPAALTLGMLFLPVPRGVNARAGTAVATAWAASVLYAALVYNPAGIAAGLEAGEHFPAARFDNNTIASTLWVAWFIPTVVVAAWSLIFRRRAAQQGVPADVARPAGERRG